MIGVWILGLLGVGLGGDEGLFQMAPIETSFKISPLLKYNHKHSKTLSAY